MSPTADSFLLVLGMARGRLSLCSDQDLVELHEWAVDYFGAYDPSPAAMVRQEQARRRNLANTDAGAAPRVGVGQEGVE
jgi:hypothetical protein